MDYREQRKYINAFEEETKCKYLESSQHVILCNKSRLN